MEAVEPARISLPQNSGELRLEAELRRRVSLCVHLEILHDRIDTLVEYLQECRIRQIRGQNASRQDHRSVPHRHGLTLLGWVAADAVRCSWLRLPDGCRVG